MKVDLKEIRCDDSRWTELAQGCVQWRGSVLSLLKVRIMLSLVVIDTNMTVMQHCEVGTVLVVINRRLEN